MDLGAYAMIDDLDIVAKENGIECPRLRGYRLMSKEDPVDLDDIRDVAGECCVDLCRSIPFWSPSGYDVHLSSPRTDYLVKYYTRKINKYDREPRWDRIHGWKRRVLKTYIHNTMQRYKKNYEVWNKYAGKDNVLYIHARIGGGNWPTYCKHVVNQPWFIEKVDDPYDSTYCDIYARIKTKADDDS